MKQAMAPSYAMQKLQNKEASGSRNIAGLEEVPVFRKLLLLLPITQLYSVCGSLSQLRDSCLPASSAHETSDHIAGTLL